MPQGRRLLWYFLIAFGAWAATVSALHLTGLHKNIEDDAVFLGAVAGMVALLLNQMHR